MAELTPLRQILYRKGMTHEMLHDITKEMFHTPIGMDRISKLATGRQKNVSIHTLLKLAYALEVSLDELVDKKFFQDSEMQ